MTVNRLGVRKGLHRKREIAVREAVYAVTVGSISSQMRDEERAQRAVAGLKEAAEHLQDLAPKIGLVVLNTATEKVHRISRVIPRPKGPPIIYLEGVRDSVNPYALVRV
jgi:hypothetical protein